MGAHLVDSGRRRISARRSNTFATSALTPLASETDNILRHCVHGFKERKMSALRIRIDETWGEPSARVYEVRVY